jgi:Peptidase family M23/Peptidase family M23 N-terminal domain
MSVDAQRRRSLRTAVLLATGPSGRVLRPGGLFTWGAMLATGGGASWARATAATQGAPDALPTAPAAAAGAAVASDPLLPEHRPVPGGVALIDLGPSAAAPVVRYNGQRVLVWGRAGTSSGTWIAVLGLPLVTPAGEVQVQVQDGAGKPRTLRLAVQGTQYAEQKLTVAPGQVMLSKENLARHERERAHLGQVMATHSDGLPASMRMRVPVPGPRSSSFGLRRIFNGQARSPHNGMDIAAPTGTPIRCPLVGRVIDVGDYFFSGRSVWLDHGSGLLSFYCHLDQIGCSAGQKLELGAPLGTVGATGRVTGPHLHWSIMLNRAYVDPALFLSA